MPKIPVFQSNAAPVASASFDKVQNQGIGVLGDILDQIRQKDQRDQEIKQKQWVLNKTIEFKQAQLQKQNELEMAAPAGAEGHAKLVSEQYDTDVSEFTSGDAPSEIAREALRNHLNEYGLSVKSNAYQFQETESSRYAHENVKNSINTLGNQLISNPETYSDAVKTSSEMIDTLRGKIPEERILEIQNDANGVLNWAASTGRISKNPYGELKLLNSGALDSQFDIQKKQSLVNAAESEIRTREAAAKEQAAKEYQKFNSDLEIRSINGQLPVSEIEALYHSGKLSPADRAQYTRAALADINRNEEKNKSIFLGNAFIRGEAIANPYSNDHEKAVNDVADLTIKSMVEDNKDPSEIMAALQGVAVKTGIVPKPAVNYMESGLMNSNNPDIMLSSASAMIDTITKNPVARNSFNEKSIAKAQLIQTLTTYLPKEQAVQKANELFYQDDNVKEERKQAIQKIEAETKKNGGDFGFTKWYGDVNDTGILDWNVSPASAGLKQQYMDAVRTAFQDTGNMETAQKIVQSKMAGNLGYSSLGGNRKLMMLPPEKFYSLPMDTAENTSLWQNKQLAEYVNAKGFKDYQRIEVSPHNTMKYGKDGLPNYRVTVIDKTGVPIIVTENNAPSIWRPDPNKEFDIRMRNRPASKKDLEELNKKPDSNGG